MRNSRNGLSGGTMKSSPSAYGYGVSISQGMTTLSAAQRVEKPYVSALRAISMSVSRDADRPETGSNTPRSIRSPPVLSMICGA